MLLERFLALPQIEVAENLKKILLHFSLKISGSPIFYILFIENKQIIIEMFNRARKPLH